MAPLKGGLTALGFVMDGPQLNRDPDSLELTTPFKFDPRCEREPTTARKREIAKPDRSCARKSGQFYLLLTARTNGT